MLTQHPEVVNTLNIPQPEENMWGLGMDKTGIGAVIIGLLLCMLGIFAIWVFLPDAIAVVKGLIGIAGVLIGLMLFVFGILIIKE